MKTKKNIFAIALSLFLGSILLYAGIIKTQESIRISSGVTTEARVVDNIKIESVDDDPDAGRFNYFPVLEFKDQHGNLVQNQNEVGRAEKNKYQIGDQVTYIYNPENPKEGTINSFSSLWVIPIILNLFGGCFVLVGLAVLFKIGKKNPLFLPNSVKSNVNDLVEA